MRSSITIFLLIVALVPASSGLSREGPWAEKVTARVDGLACPFCAYGAEKKLERLEGVDSLDIRINHGLVILYSKEMGRIDEKLINQKIRESGFTPRGIERESFPPPADKSKADPLEKIQLNIRGTSTP